MSNLTLIETAGSPFEMGVQHGRQAAAKVRGAHRRFCRAEVGSPAERARLTAAMEETLARRRPAALDEMRGIAAGAGVPYEFVRDLNFSVELWSQSWLPSSARGCTLVGLQSGAAGWLVGKTMDVAPGDDEYIVVQRARPASGYAFIHVTYAGTIWTDGGVNERGLAQVNSSLETTACNPDGFPVFVMARALLQQCATAAEAVDAAAASDAVNYGGNFLLADDQGEAAVVERSVGAHAVRALPPGAGVLFATNHNLAPALDSILGGSPELLANSRARYERVARRPPELSLEALQELFRDHAQPGGICQHGQAGLDTIGSLIAATRPRQLWASIGAPCQNPFVPVSL